METSRAKPSNNPAPSVSKEKRHKATQPNPPACEHTACIASKRKARGMSLRNGNRGNSFVAPALQSVRHGLRNGKPS